MQDRRQRLAALDTGLKVSKPDRFTPLLSDIRSSLGDDWAFYEECIEGVLTAAAKHQDTTAWIEQMQQLVKGVRNAHNSHHGMLFLLREMGIRVPKQQSWGEGEGSARKYLSPPLSPPDHSLRISPTSIANTKLCSVQLPSIMASPLPLRSLRPITPAIAGWPAPCSATPRPQQPSQQPQANHQQQRQHQPRVLRDGVLPFDFSALVQPGLTFPSPKEFRNYHCPPDDIEGHASTTPNPLRQTSKDPLFFSDSALKVDVAGVFGVEVQPRVNDQDSGGGILQAPQRLPYDVDDNDLAGWKARLETGGDGEVKANGSVTGTWPPWNFRFDLDI